MSETIEPKSLSKNDLMRAFGDRVLWKPEKVEKEYLGLDEGLSQKNLIGENFADIFEQAHITDSNTYDPHEHLGQEFFNKFEFYKRAEKPINAQLIKSGPKPITLVTGKYMEDLKQKDGRTHQMVLHSIFIFKGDLTHMDANKIKEARKDKNGEKIANFQMRIEDNDTFSLHHRIVKPEYRGPQNNSNETLGNVGLKACEQIVKNHADKEGKPKKIELNVTQLDVMIWLYNNGYAPKTAKGKEKFKRVLNADENLVIVDDNYIWEKDKWTPGVDVVESRHNGFMIVFEKTIEPEVKSANEAVEETRAKIIGLA